MFFIEPLDRERVQPDGSSLLEADTVLRNICRIFRTVPDELEIADPKMCRRHMYILDDYAHAGKAAVAVRVRAVRQRRRRRRHARTLHRLRAHRDHACYDARSRASALAMRVETGARAQSAKLQ